MIHVLKSFWIEYIKWDGKIIAAWICQSTPRIVWNNYCTLIHWKEYLIESLNTYGMMIFDMEMLSTLQALCEWIVPQKANCIELWCFICCLIYNLLKKQLNCQWFHAPECSCNLTIIGNLHWRMFWFRSLSAFIIAYKIKCWCTKWANGTPSMYIIFPMNYFHHPWILRLILLLYHLFLYVELVLSNL